LRDWTEAGVFDAVYKLLLDQLRALDQLDLDVAVVDGSHVRALKGGKRRAPRPSIGLASARSTT
jgi:hypothetical protein